MIDIKVSLTVAVPGAVPFSNVETPIEGMTEPFTVFITEKDANP